MKPLSRITLGVATAWFSLTAPLCAQRQSLNADWLFQRVDNRSAATWQAGQQGTDWSSQFNVQYSEAGSGHSSLAVPDSLLQAEQFQLRAAAAWQAVELPHTAYVEPYVIQSPWQGVCYYKRNLHITPEQAEGLLWIEFEGAMQLADIWINGKHASQHAGGFTTFVVDATGLLRAGQNELVVRLDNRDNGLIPPGKPLGTLDFCYHSGLYRDVNLICKPRLHITHPLLAGKVAGGGIFVTYPQVDAQQAVVQVQTEVANRNRQAERLTVRQTLYEWKRGKGCGRKVAQGEMPVELSAQADHTLRQQLCVKQPRLWSPDAPNLYVLRTELVQGKEVVDTEDTRIGLRHLEITREGCFINGKRYELDGTNRHQEYPYVGNAISDRAQYRDVWQMRNYGFNTVRLGHYPQDPAVLDACDKLGLLAIEPIPGWQYFSKDPLFQSLTYYNIQEMMRRDRNHPCIIMWETTLNESWPPTEWKDGAVRTAHAEMPEGPCYTSGDSYGYSGFDVCYNDWRGEDFSRPNNSTKPAFIREYYDYEFGGHYSTSRVTRGDGERALRQNLWNAQWSQNSNRSRSNHTVGGAVWSMYDYNRGCCDNICYSGVADLYRQPKYSLHYYRSQMAPGSFTPEGAMPHELFIASHWDEQSSDTIVVLGNVAEVALRVNGTEVARQKADRGACVAYTPQTNGGNCDKLAYPPFTFKGIRFAAGTIEAVGYDADGRQVARTEVRTPGQPREFQLSYFESGAPASQNDLLIVYATLTDEHGVPCHTNGQQVVLRALSGGTVAGPNATLTEDGVASFLVRTADAPMLQLQADWGSQRIHWKVKLIKE